MMKVSFMFLLAIMLLGTFRGALGEDVRQPKLDKDGRFYIYRDGKTGLSFIPYGYMPEEAADMLVMDLESKKHLLKETQDAVNGSKKSTEVASNLEAKTCISVKVTWKAPFWCGVAWISGPTGAPGDDKAWWGEDKRGWYYDLSGLKKKKLVFFALGAKGGERIQVKCGILGDKPFGDSLTFPAETPWLKLKTTYTRYEIDLSKTKPEDLKKICSGFVFVLSRDQQDETAPTVTEFYIGSVFFE